MRVSPNFHLLRYYKLTMKTDFQSLQTELNIHMLKLQQYKSHALVFKTSHCLPKVKKKLLTEPHAFTSEVLELAIVKSTAC